jgi:hypothetical protein
MNGGDRQVIEQIEWAHRVVDAARVPDDLRVVAFQHALGVSPELLGSDRAIRSLPLLRTPSPAAVSLNDALTRISEALTLHEDVVECIYEHAGGGIRLALERSLLPEPDNKAASMRHVALLVAVGRQAGSSEDETPFSVMRRECGELGVLDGPNFAAEVGKLEMRVTGGPNTRAAHALRHHYGLARALIRRIVAAGEVAQ